MTKKGNKIIYVLNVLLVFFVCVIFFSAYKIYLWQNENRENNELINNLISYTNDKKIKNNNQDDKSKIDFESLYKINEDTVAWIKVNGTNINYPVVKTKDNSYYLNHNFAKNKNSAGAIFIDYRNNLKNDKNIIFYGHNRKDGTMFGTLNNVLDKKWCDNLDNRRITISYPDKDVFYEVFSVYSIDNEEYYLNTDIKTNEEYNIFLQKINERSIYNFDTDLSSIEEIITLSTCGTTSKTRIVLHAKNKK